MSRHILNSSDFSSASRLSLKVWLRRQRFPEFSGTLLAADWLQERRQLSPCLRHIFGRPADPGWLPRRGVFGQRRQQLRPFLRSHILGQTGRSQGGRRPHWFRLPGAAFFFFAARLILSFLCGRFHDGAEIAIHRIVDRSLIGNFLLRRFLVRK